MMQLRWPALVLLLAIPSESFNSTRFLRNRQPQEFKRQQVTIKAPVEAGYREKKNGPAGPQGPLAALVFPSCYNACSFCEQQNFKATGPVSGEVTCNCVVHCWAGNDSDLCERMVEAGWSHANGGGPGTATLAKEMWSAACEGSAVMHMPAPIMKCKNSPCSTFPTDAEK